MSTEKTREYHVISKKEQDKRDRQIAHARAAYQKKLYVNPSPPVPDAKARIAAAIAQAEQTQRNIDALTNEGEEEC